MIHAAFLGEAFQKRVTDNCDVIKVPTSARGAWQSYVFLAFALMLGRRSFVNYLTFLNLPGFDLYLFSILNFETSMSPYSMLDTPH